MADGKLLNTKGTLPAKKAKAPKAPRAAASEASTGTGERHRKWARGVVVSDKMNKTRVVRVDRQVRDPFYKKYVVRSKRFKAHDEKNEARTGDVVLMLETRPMSAQKRWVISKIERRGNAGAVQTTGEKA